MQFIEQNRLMGKGFGYIDVHLSASAVLTGVPLWTYDRRPHEPQRGDGYNLQPGINPDKSYGFKVTSVKVSTQPRGRQCGIAHFGARLGQRRHKLRASAQRHILLKIV